MAELPGSLDQLSGENYYSVVVPKKSSRNLVFSINASRPQGVGIYGPNNQRYAERYSTADFTNVTLNNETDDDVTYYVAGFSFYPAPPPRGTWFQSSYKMLDPDSKYLIGFDDYINDNDFDDLVIKIEVPIDPE